MFTSYASGQDSHFSQFNSSPLNLNPALTGSINGVQRVVANYRNQWPQILQSDAYNAFALSFDRRINFKSGDYLGLGISGSRDISGSTRFSTTQAVLSFSFAKMIFKSGARSHTIIGGVQPGFGRRSIDPNNLRWSTQHDGMGGFDPFAPSGIVPNPDIVYFNVNSGLVWLSHFGEALSVYGGFSAFHLNQPNISFQYVTTHKFTLRTSFHAGAEINLFSTLTLMPSVIYQKQNVHAQLTMGTRLGLRTSNSMIRNIEAGFFYRAGQNIDGGLHSDALVAMLSAQVLGVQVGFSYDYTISSLNISALGAFELSVAYVIGKDNNETAAFELPNF